MADLTLDAHSCQALEGGGSALLDRWLVAEGDHVTSGQLLAQVVLDGQPVEVRSPHAGAVEQILVSAGERVVPGQALARLVDF
jgi:pyruvate/2-oxoglutarate dehydrogenase complex dihydrolipoamide acyltransferase (E2) component